MLTGTVGNGWVGIHPRIPKWKIKAPLAGAGDVLQRVRKKTCHIIVTTGWMLIRPLFEEDYLKSLHSEQQLGIWRAFLDQQMPSLFPGPEVGLGSA